MSLIKIKKLVKWLLYCKSWRKETSLIISKIYTWPGSQVLNQVVMYIVAQNFAIQSNSQIELHCHRMLTVPMKRSTKQHDKNKLSENQPIKYR